MAFWPTASCTPLTNRLLPVPLFQVAGQEINRAISTGEDSSRQWDRKGRPIMVRTMETEAPVAVNGKVSIPLDLYLLACTQAQLFGESLRLAGHLAAEIGTNCERRELKDGNCESENLEYLALTLGDSGYRRYRRYRRYQQYLL